MSRVQGTTGSVSNVLGMILVLCTGITQAQVTPKPSAAKAAPKPAASPKQSPTQKAEKEPSETASVLDAAQAVDLRRLFDFKEVQFTYRTATRLEGLCEGDVKSTAELFLAELAKLGCKPNTEPYSQMITNEYAQAGLLKDDYAFSLTVMPLTVPQGNPSRVSFTLLNQGNIDVRELPLVDGAKLLYGNRTTAIFVTPKKVAEAILEVRQKFAAGGWQEFNKPFTQKAEIPDQETIQFRQHGVELIVAAGVAPAQGGQSTLQYIVTMSRKDLPAPSNAEQLEFDDFRPYLQCDIPGELADAAEYFETAFPLVGFPEERTVRVSKEEAIIVFRSVDHDVIIGQLTRTDAGKNQAKIRVLTAEFLAELAKPSAKPQTQSQKHIPETHEPILAMPTSAESVRCPATAMIQYHTKKSLADAVQEVRQTYKSEKWEEDQQFSVITPMAAVIELHRKDAKLTVLVIHGSDESSTEVVLSGTDIARKKPE